MHVHASGSLIGPLQLLHLSAFRQRPSDGPCSNLATTDSVNTQSAWDCHWRDSPNEFPVPGLPSTLPRLCTSTEYEVFVGSVWLSPPAIRSDQARLRQHIKSRRSPSCLGSLVQVNSSPPRGCQSLKSSGDRLTNRFRPDLLSFPPARAAATLVFISKVSACPPRNAVDSGRCFAWSQDR